MIVVEAALLTLIVVCAVAALEADDLPASLILFGALSFLSAAFYAAVGAPDVSFTEAALGAVIATVFFISAIHGSTHESGADRTPPGGRLARLGSWLVLIGAAAALSRAALFLPEVGDPGAPAAVRVSPRYIEQALAETGALNMVTGVIVDYRGFDTLGETAVIFTAGLACLLILPAALAARGSDRR